MTGEKHFHWKGFPSFQKLRISSNISKHFFHPNWMIHSGNDQYTKPTWFDKFRSSMLNRLFPVTVWILEFHSVFSYMDGWIWTSKSNSVCASLLKLDTMKQFQVLSLCFVSYSCSPKQWLAKNTFIERGFQASKYYESPVITANIISPKLDETFS